ncbi:MAG: hypothetical protein EXS13_10125 [Planctomycetes bacterium]|nr:hypothetical protein [Planctomycetota bacterium]
MTLRRALRLVSWLALVATLWPAIAYFRGTLDLDAVKRWMLIATVVWFASAWAAAPPTHQ